MRAVRQRAASDLASFTAIDLTVDVLTCLRCPGYAHTLPCAEAYSLYMRTFSERLACYEEVLSASRPLFASTLSMDQ